MRFFNKIYDKYLLWKYIYPFNGRNLHREISPNNTLCVFSFPRSGSTWLSEMLLNIQNSCLFDEPFMRNRIKGINQMPDNSLQKFNEIKKLRFFYFQPVPKFEEWNEAFYEIERLLSGKVVSIGLYDDYGLSRLKQADYFVVKLNYAALFGSWIQQNFPVASITLLRHPLSVVASSLLHEWTKEIKIDKDQYIPNIKYPETFLKYRYIFEKYVNNRLELIAFLWAINVKEGILKLDSKRTFPVFYEDLVTNFDSTVDLIADFIGKELPKDRSLLKNTPSKSTSNRSLAKIGTGDLIKAPRSLLSKKQILSVLNIVEQFEIDFYTEEYFPDHLNFKNAWEIES